jgi:hemerythrin-like domain-containing protein
MTHPFNPAYEGATLAQLKNENVQHFLYIHNYLRNEMRMLLQLIDELIEEPGGETAEINQSIIQALIRSGKQYGQHLHAHHHGETSLLFPTLKRAGLASEIVDRLNHEHDELSALIDEVTMALSGMETAEFPKINDRLRQLGNALRSHLDYEERHVCPLLANWSSTTEFYMAIFRETQG